MATTNRNFVVGYVTEVIGDRVTLKGTFAYKFTIVVDQGHRDATGEWIPNKVFYTVEAYRDLARNVMTTLARHPKQGIGMHLIVCGKFRDDSFRASGGYTVPRRTLLADNIGPALNWAIAAVVKYSPDDETDALAIETDSAAAIAA